MGSENADLDPQEAADCLIKRILVATKEDNGKFFAANVPTYKGVRSEIYRGQVYPF